MLQDIAGSRALRRALHYALLLLAFRLLQDLVFSRVALLGVRPFLPPLAVVAVGFFEGGLYGGLFGLAAGLCSDALSTDTVFLCTALFPLLGFAAGTLTRFLLNRRFFSCFLVSLASLVLTALCQALPLLLRNTGSLPALVLTAVLQTLWSLPFVPLAYFPARGIATEGLLSMESELKFQPPSAPSAVRKSAAPKASRTRRPHRKRRSH